MDQNNQRKPMNQKNVPPTKNQELMARIVLIVVVIAVAALLVLGIVLGIKNCGGDGNNETTTADIDGTTTTGEDYDETTTTDKDGTTAHKPPVASDLTAGNLILVNYIDEDNCNEFAFPKKLHVITRPDNKAPFALSSGDIKLQKEVWNAFSDMINALKEEEEIFATLGDDMLIIHTAYRAYEDQPSTSSIPAGYSEYHTGLAMRIKVFGADKKTYELDDPKYADIAAWIEENAADYGFIFRYLDGKEDITGVEHEDLPWHIRYVGVPAAKIMQAEANDGNEMCLEEFIEFIKDYSKNDAYKITVDGIEYSMYYVEGDETPDVEDFYQMSGNNVDGFIITLKK